MIGKISPLQPQSHKNQIINKSRNTLLSNDAKVISSFIGKLLGLLNPKNPRSLILQTRFGIHTFGLKQEIDILILDKDSKVVKIKHNLKPNRLFFWNPKYDCVIELPIGTLGRAKVRLGNEIIVK